MDEKKTNEMTDEQKLALLQYASELEHQSERLKLSSRWMLIAPLWGMFLCSVCFLIRWQP